MIIILTPLHSQQLALLGYIQLDGRTLYIKERKYVYPKSPVPDIPDVITTMPVIYKNRSVVYILTTDQNQALRVK